METYLPIIQATLAEWLQLTIDHPLYVAALVIGVWLLTALLYSIKIAGLNKKNVASEKAKTTAETNSNTAQQQLQQAQQELAAITEQLGQQQQATEAEKQRTSAFAVQQTQRNQQIASIIQRLASSFDIGERPLPITEDSKAEDLWQQHDKVINQLIETLRTEQQAKTELQKFYQAEQAKVTETEARLSSLKATSESQANLVLALQQQQNDSQQALIDTIKKHQTASLRLLELEQQVAQLANVQPLAAIKTTTPIAPPAISVEPVVIADSTKNFETLFKKPEQPPIVEQPISVEAEPVSTDVLVKWVETEKPAPEVITNSTVEVVKKVVKPIQETEKTDKGAVLKGWYNKATAKKSAAEVAPKPVEPEPKPSPATASANTEKNSSVKSLFQKFTVSKPEPVEVQPELIVEMASTSEEQTDYLEKPTLSLRNSESLDTEKTPEKTSVAKGLINKFSKAKPEPIKTAPASTPKPVAEKITPPPMAKKPSKCNQAAKKIRIAGEAPCWLIAFHSMRST